MPCICVYDYDLFELLSVLILCYVNLHPHNTIISYNKPHIFLDFTLCRYSECIVVLVLLYIVIININRNSPASGAVG